jgi:hypothetical protein
VMAMRGLPRGAEREKVSAGAASQGAVGASMGLTAGGSACSNAPPGNGVLNSGPPRSGTAPRQRGIGAPPSGLSTANGVAAAQDSRASQGFVRRVMTDDALDVDVGLAERLRERIRSRLGGASGERGAACGSTETCGAGDSRTTPVGSRRGAETRPRRPPQADTGLAPRTSGTSPALATSASVPTFRQPTSPSAVTLGTPSAGLARSPSVKAHSPPPSTSSTSEAVLMANTIRRESSPLKPQRSQGGSRMPPSSSLSGRCQGALGYIRSEWACTPTEEFLKLQITIGRARTARATASNNGATGFGNPPEKHSC